MKSSSDVQYYCSYCGMSMIRTLKSTHRYSTTTGQEIFYVHYKCPKKRGLFSLHDEEDAHGIYYDGQDIHHYSVVVDEDNNEVPSE